MSLISGNVTFNSGSVNYSANANVIVGASSFCGDAQNCGLISSGYFFDTAINAGIISCNAIFAGTSVNSGTASIAVFSGNAINCSSVTTCAIFVDTAVNAGSVANASFCASSVNNGIVNQCGSFYGSATNCATVCGNAIFADTASNAASAIVCGNADFAVTASNAGTVNGTTGVYTPPSSNWYDDSSSFSRNIVNGGSTQFDEGGGVKGAELSSSKSIDTNTSGAFAGDFTVEYFVKLNVLSGFPIGNIRSGGGTSDWALGHPNDGSVYLSSTNQGHGQYGAGSLSVGHWSHIALVRNNGTLKLYANGIEKHTYTSSPAFDDSADIIINPAIWASYHIDGKMAMVRVSSVARYTDGTYTVPVSIFSSDADTLLLLNFGATTAPTVTAPNWYDDTSSATRAVTVGGTVTQEDEGSGVLVANFNNGYLSVANPMSLSTGDFTVEYFIKYDSAGIGYQPGVVIYTPNIGDYNATFLSYIEVANYFSILMTNSAGNTWQTYVPGNDHGPQIAPVANQWNHIAATRDGNTFALYLNGVLIGTNTISDTTIYDVNRVLEIGRYTAFPQGSLSLHGRIAGLRIVKGAVVYSGSTYTIPTTLPTAISGTELLLNFGATAVPTVVASHWYDDTSSAAHAVTLNGTVTQSDEGGGVKAATSNAVASYLSAQTTAISTSDFTWEAFIKTSSTASAPTILFGQYGSDGLVAFVQVGSSTIRISTIAYGFDTSTAVTLDAWNHFVVQRTSGTITAYLNGNLVATDSVIGGINETNFIINGSSGSTQYSNSIAGFRYVLGTALYSGSTITIPTSLPTNVSGTELLLNFGATAAPTVSGGGGGGGNPSSGTVLSTETNTIYINEVSQNFNNGTYDVIADGNGGSTNGNYQYASAGTEFYDDTATYHYVSDGVGGYTRYVRSGYMLNSGLSNTTYIWQVNQSFNNGTYDEVADGSGGSTNVNYQYAPNGTEIYDDGSTNHYVSNGSGGYTQYYRLGYVISTETNYLYINEISQNVANGNYDVIADGSGSSTNGSAYNYPSSGTELYYNSPYSYQADGSGSYTQIDINAAADAWGATNDGQYQSSGRWYYGGTYVGDQTAYNAAVDAAAAAQLIIDADAWGVTNDGQYQSSGRWYYGGAHVADEAAYNAAVAAAEIAAADAWGAANNGQYQSSGRWYYNGVYLLDEVAYGIALANAWGQFNDGQYNNDSTYGCGGSLNIPCRYYFNGIYIGDEAAYNIALADDFGITRNNNGQYQSSGRWYWNGAYVGDEAAYIAAGGT